MPINSAPPAPDPAVGLAQVLTEYTQIPPTTDGAYWRVKYRNGDARMTVFAPRNKALHRKLLEAQRTRVQAEATRRQQLSRGPQSQNTTNRATWGLESGGPD